MEIYYIYKISESYIKNIIVLDCCTRKKSYKHKYNVKKIASEKYSKNHR